MPSSRAPLNRFRTTIVKRVKTCARAGGKAPAGNTADGFLIGPLGLRSTTGDGLARPESLVRDSLGFLTRGLASTSEALSDDDVPETSSASEPESSDDAEPDEESFDFARLLLGFV